jgi:hypothetical protein
MGFQPQSAIAVVEVRGPDSANRARGRDALPDGDRRSQGNGRLIDEART